ncbi:MAG: ribosome-associated translation inhibitor RaiA [Acidobacteriota bacterium]
MRLDITGRHVEITPPLRQLLDKRLSRLDRVLNDAAISAKITLTKEKYRLCTEMVVHTRGGHMLSGDGEGTAWPVSIRQATEKIEQQADKLKGKWSGRKRKGTAAREVPEPSAPPAPAGPRVVRATRYGVKPMSVDDAALRLDGSTESFLVFRNQETETVNILYRRKDGNLGLIEPD